MKRVNDEYLKIIIYIVFGFVFVISTYFIIINIRHYYALSAKVIVSEIDKDYTDFKKNINKIEDKLNNYPNGNELVNTLNVLKGGGVFRLLPNSQLTYYDLSVLNDYFMNDIINNCWISKLKGINKDESNAQIVDILVNNSEYLSDHFIDNGLTLYDSKSDNKIQNDYAMILKNYLSFSEVLLSLINN